MWPESIQRMGLEWFKFGKLGRPNSPRYGDVLRPSPRLHGRSRRTDSPRKHSSWENRCAMSGKSGAPAAYIGDGLPPVLAKRAAKIRRWEYVEMGSCSRNFGLGREIQKVR